MAQRPILDESTVALTFDDVLLAPRPSDVLPGEADVSSRVTREISGQDPRHLLGHGHGDRRAARHRHGAGRRHRRRSTAT